MVNLAEYNSDWEELSPYKIYGELEWMDYEYTLTWEASLYPQIGRKYLLENIEESWYTDGTTLMISDYVEPKVKEDIYLPLEWEELEEYLMYYVDMYKRKTGKSFFRRMQWKINFKK